MIALISSISCKSQKDKGEIKIEKINGELSTKIYKKLFYLSGDSTINPNDTLTFFIIPVEKTCIPCRNTSVLHVLSLIKKNNKKNKVIITAPSAASLYQFFSEIEKPLEYKSELIYDTTNYSYKNDLIFTQPTIYHCTAKAVFQKIRITPKNISSVLKEFIKN